MSSLWTPEGEHRVAAAGDKGPAPGTSDAGPLGSTRDRLTAEGEIDEAAVAQLAELRRQLLATPVEVVVANHAYGLFELAAIHLSERPPHLEQARLAIDALGAVVEGLTGRLGEADQPLTDALAQLRLAFVQLQTAPTAPPDGAGA